VDDEDDEQSTQAERRPDRKENEQADMLASHEAGLPVLSGPPTQTDMAQMPDSERFDTGDVTSMDPSAQLFEDWLEDLGYFHNIFPSA
jgi:hypothetical protein